MIKADENKMEGLQPMGELQSKEKSDFISVICRFWDECFMDLKLHLKHFEV